MTRIIELYRLYVLGLIDLFCIGLAVQILTGDRSSSGSVFVLIRLIAGTVGPILHPLARQGVAVVDGRL